jgi:ATP-binding cassette, subfamily C, bacterial CydD
LHSGVKNHNPSCGQYLFFEVNKSDIKVTEEIHVSIHRRLYGLAKGVHGFLPSLAVLSFFSTAVIIFQMYLLSVIINDVFMLNKSPANHLLYLLTAAIIVRALLIWVRERIAQQKAVVIKSGLRLRLFDHLIKQGAVFSRERKTGELVNTLTDGAGKLEDYFTRYIPSIIHIAVLPAVIIAFAIYTDWLSGLIMLLTAPLILFFMWLIGTWAKSLTSRQWKEMSAMSAHFLDVLQGIKTLKVFNRNHAEAAAVAEVSNNFRAITMQVLKVAFLSGMVLELAASISIAMVALQVGIRLIEGMMGYQMGLFVLLLTPEFYLPFRSLGQHHHTGMEGASAAEKIFEMLDSDPQRIKSQTEVSLNVERLRVAFAEVDFYYPNAAQPALHRISCSIEPGKLTAVVGRTGAGKTTFSQLLMGALKPASGQILFNGISLDQIHEDELNRIIACVPQHPYFFNLTVLENLLMADAKATPEQVEEACIKAGAHAFITQLPQGYHTQLSENAARLSGGEKQRLAIARAFLKNAPLLILDEPTSNLDPESEELIARATAELVKNRTTLIIAHRLKTIFRAGKILVFENGQIAETGNHDSLIAREGIYAGYLKTIESGGAL